MSKSSIVANLVCNNLRMPPIGLGTFMLERLACKDTISNAIKNGYRRIDCAPVYFNEDAIGDALQSALADNSNRIQRNDLYLVSKLASPFHRKGHVELALRKTLNDLRIDYLDLYLIHWPVAFKYVEIDPSKRGYKNEDIDDSANGDNIDPTVSIKETWSAMEKLVDDGLVREIGVSNMPVSLLHELLCDARIPPAVNQVELHPYLQQANLLKYCQARGVAVQAYSPLGTPGYKETNEPNVLDDAVLKTIALRHGVTAAQLCIAWALQRGCSVVTKSTRKLHLKENMASQELVLTNDEMNEIASLDRRYRFFRPEDWWGSMAMAVFD
jgi:diketogulonate reductase-like aldo/keto reductase